MFVSVIYSVFVNKTHPKTDAYVHEKNTVIRDEMSYSKEK